MYTHCLYLRWNSYQQVQGSARPADPAKPNKAELVVTFEGIPCKFSCCRAHTRIEGGGGSFSVPSRVALDSPYVYCTACSNCFKVGPVLEMNRSFLWGFLNLWNVGWVGGWGTFIQCKTACGAMHHSLLLILPIDLPYFGKFKLLAVILNYTRC